MIGLPYNVFIRKDDSKNTWHAPIWRSFSTEEDAVSETLNLLCREQIDYAEVNGPVGSRLFVSDDQGPRELT